MSVLKQILPTTRRDGEDYATFDDIVTSEDTLAYDVRVPWWTDKAGNGRVLRVRGLSTEDEVAIERAGRVAAATYRKQNPHDDMPPRSDWQAEYLEVLQRGVVTPRIDRDRARMLLKKNARAIDELVRFIRVLNSLDEATIATLVAAEANITDPAAAADEERDGGAVGDPGAAPADLPAPVAG
jgi:hypothetical protein